MWKTWKHLPHVNPCGKSLCPSGPWTKPKALVEYFVTPTTIPILHLDPGFRLLCIMRWKEKSSLAKWFLTLVALSHSVLLCFFVAVEWIMPPRLVSTLDPWIILLSVLVGDLELIVTHSQAWLSHYCEFDTGSSYKFNP